MRLRLRDGDHVTAFLAWKTISGVMLQCGSVSGTEITEVRVQAAVAGTVTLQCGSVSGTEITQPDWPVGRPDEPLQCGSVSGTEITRMLRTPI